MAKLTDVQLRAWVSTATPISGKSDGGGLTFTLSKGGIAAWVLRYRIGGKQKELSLGRYPDMSLRAAREAAAIQRVKVQQLVDVAAEKQRQKAELKNASSMKELGELWLNHAVRQRHKHPQTTVRVFERDIYPKFAQLQPSAMTTAEITRFLGQVAVARPTVANDILRYMRAMFSYGMVLGVVERNPCDGIKITHAGGLESARSRALTSSEIAKLLKTMQASGPSFTRDNQLAVMLLLCLGCRKMELLGASWSELDLEGKRWSIPAARTKTQESRELPLPDPVIAWFAELKIRACENTYVFPNRRSSKRYPHVSPDTLNAALHGLDHGLEHFTVHDLRRTSRSLMTELGIDFDIAERILGHRLPGVAAIYDRGNTQARQAAALKRLSLHILQLMSDSTFSNIHQMRRSSV